MKVEGAACAVAGPAASTAKAVASHRIPFPSAIPWAPRLRSGGPRVNDARAGYSARPNRSAEHPLVGRVVRAAVGGREVVVDPHAQVRQAVVVVRLQPDVAGLEAER